MKLELFKPPCPSFCFLALFVALLGHKQVSRGLESNKRESLYNKTPIEQTCSVRIGKILVLSFDSVHKLANKTELDQYFPNTDLTQVQ